jgi:recombination protein RecR
MYPKSLQKLIEDFNKLPGVGLKTAERFALHIVSSFSSEETLEFSKHVKDILEHIKTCTKCHMLSEDTLCTICQDSARDNTIMVVSDMKDVITLESMQTYRGYYHVLGGLIDFSRGITDKDLHIESLKSRLHETEELIIATNSTVEGELTAQYIKALFQEDIKHISRLAYGLPVGTDFKYADSKTLAVAVENRKKF